MQGVFCGGRSTTPRSLVADIPWLANRRWRKICRVAVCSDWLYGIAFPHTRLHYYFIQRCLSRSLGQAPGVLELFSPSQLSAVLSHSGGDPLQRPLADPHRCVGQFINSPPAVPHKLSPLPLVCAGLCQPTWPPAA